MPIAAIFLPALLLFAIIFFAVRLAINPLLNTPNEITPENNDFELVNLRDIEILSNTELEEVQELYKNRSISKENYEQYQKYTKILNELKDMDYLSDEQFNDKINKLKEYYKIN